MSYCPKCGTDVGDAAFCYKCGNAIAPINQSKGVEEVQKQEEIRKESLERINKAYEYFVVKERYYDECEIFQDKLEKYLEKSKVRKIVFGSVFVGVATLFSINVISVVVVDGSELGEVACVLILPLILFVVGIILLVPSIIWEANKKKSVAELQNLISVYEGELKKYYEEYAECPVGFQYSDPSILRIIKENIESGRADTIKESIQLTIDDAMQLGVTM